MKNIFVLIITGLIFVYGLELSSGWQLKGSSKKIDIKKFNNKDILSVWSYEKGNWKIYLPNNSKLQNQIISSSKIKSLNYIKAGEGFWILSDKNLTININNVTKFAPFYPVGSENIDLNSSFIYSFIITDGNHCVPYWDWAMGEKFDTFKIKKDSIISFGGEGADKKTLAYVCNENALFSAYKKIINTFNIKWIDFDIEGKMLDENISNIKRFKALKKLQDIYNIKISLTLPVMPNGFDDKVINLIKLAKEENLSINSYNLMLMDYGEFYPADDKNKTLMFDYSKKAIDSVNKNLKDIFNTDNDFYFKIGAIAMIGVNDISNEIFYKEDFIKLRDYVIEKQMPLLSFWSILRDKSGNDLSTSSGLSIKDYGNVKYEYFKIGSGLK